MKGKGEETRMEEGDEGKRKERVTGIGGDGR